MESDGSVEALNITGKDVSEGRARWYGKPFVKCLRFSGCRGQNESRAAARRERMSLNLAALSIAWEETSTFVHMEVYASVSWFLSISISN